MFESVKKHDNELIGLTFVLIKFDKLTENDIYTVRTLTEEQYLFTKDNIMVIFFKENTLLKDFVQSIEQTLFIPVKKVYTDRFLGYTSFLFALEHFNDLEDGFFKYGDVLELVKTISEEYKEEVLKELYDDINIKDLIFTYVKSNMNVIKTSELLGLHRNTINNKIRMIKEVTGYNPNNFEDLMVLYLTIL